MDIEHKEVLLNKIVEYSIEDLKYYNEQAKLYLEIVRDGQQAIEKQKLNPSLDIEKEYQLERNIPKILLNTFFLGLYSFFEYRVRFLASRVELNNFSDLRVKHLKGNTTDQILQYLYLETSLKKDQLKKFDKPLNFYRTVRNKIIHEGGSINLHKNATTQFKQEIKKENYVKIDNREYIVITSSFFLNEFIGFSSLFLETIIENLVDNKA